MTRALLSFILFACLMSSAGISTSHAGSICDAYRKDSPYMYKLYCSESGSGASKPSGASSTFSESFKLNSAALPTSQSPYGLEAISTQLSSGGSFHMPTFALIKGFHRFGTGISTSGANTFFSNDVVQRTSRGSEVTDLGPGEPEKGYLTHLNLGTSFALFDPSWGPSINLGLSARYNKTTNTLGGGPAILVSTSMFGVGYGVSDEKISNQFGRIRFYTLQLSAHLFGFELEYNRLTIDDSGALDPVQIVTVSRGFGSFVFTVAGRTLNYLSEGTVTQFHAAIQYMLSNHFSAGLMHNYIPGGLSLGLQVYL